MDQPSSVPPYPRSVAVNKYERLKSHSLIASLLSFFMQKPDDTLLSFDQVQQLISNRQKIDRGTQLIPISHIVGSVGRYRDFNRAFLPRQGANAERWAQLDVALNELRNVPPIEVYKIGDVYFVRDGNHRVSVAKANGLTHIEAQVTEVETRVPLTPDVDLDSLIIKAEYARFQEKTHLNETQPDADIELTEPGRYEILLEHIEVHRYYLGLHLQRDVTLEEAAASWYDTVYLPVVEAIRATGILKEFPHRTEADLYLWVAYHRERLRDLYGVMPAPTEVAARLAEQFSERPLVRLGKTVRRVMSAAARAARATPEPPESVDHHETGADVLKTAAPYIRPDNPDGDQ
jgi:hypothetical protein